MPWWLWFLLALLISLGLLNVALWQKPGDGAIRFIIRFVSGIVFITAGVIWLVSTDIQTRRWIRKNKSASYRFRGELAKD